MPGWRDDELPDYAPSRAELDREEHEELMAATYEVRYQQFCAAHLLDPEDPASATEYEKEWEDEVERGGDPRTC